MIWQVVSPRVQTQETVITLEQTKYITPLCCAELLFDVSIWLTLEGISTKAT